MQRRLCLKTTWIHVMVGTTIQSIILIHHLQVIRVTVKVTLSHGTITSTITSTIKKMTLRRQRTHPISWMAFAIQVSSPRRWLILQKWTWTKQNTMIPNHLLRWMVGVTTVSVSPMMIRPRPLLERVQFSKPKQQLMNAQVAQMQILRIVHVYRHWLKRMEKIMIWLDFGRHQKVILWKLTCKNFYRMRHLSDFS